MERCPRSSQATAVAAGVAVAVGAGVGYGIWRLQRKRRASAVTAGSGGSRGLRVQLLYGSMTGTSQRWARQLAEELATEACLEHESVSVEDLTTFQFDNLLAAPARARAAVHSGGWRAAAALRALLHAAGRPRPRLPREPGGTLAPALRSARLRQRGVRA
eukprot:CAMPEP_0179078152 /NCGR_PEP_ID=MMETSP0796-20121207/34978_1 /TAXON_ID=73915 /ORGANISM="Pyrodinium bahamense, Strain pbaha01" /LENGTH=159 /DNA_ID=CAMNT_0020775445 /DNA_START=10 /DNA_END=485 /DNA_ORIENTATION=+